MTRLPDEPNLPGVPGSGAEGDAMPAPRRAASATLRREEPTGAAGASLDPAQRSLAEALRISFFLLQIGMVALVALFLLSGARQVRESERGIRLTFGKVAEQDVAPGLHFSWPFPVGEFLTVQTGLVSVDLDTEFWPRLRETQKQQPLDQLTTLGAMGLRPGEDGSLITGDNNLVHTQWRVEYHRASATDFIRNVHPPDEERLVRAAVERGVVRTVAELSMEDLLKQGAAVGPVAPPADAPGAGDGAAPAEEGGVEAADAGAAAAEPNGAEPGGAARPSRPARASNVDSAIAARVRAIAQETLDATNAGIRIDQVALKQLTPPLPVRPMFQQVQAAQSQAAKAREDAEKERRGVLNGVAGLAHPIILERIDAYERAIEAGDERGAALVMAQIDRLLEGEPVEIDGVAHDRLASGEATDIINRARQYRTEVVSTNRGDVESFRAKLEQYRVNPAVLLNREWTDAYLDLLALPTVQVMLIPPDSSLELALNADPEYMREQERERNKRQILETIGQRDQEFRRARRALNESDPNPKPRQ